ncbi:MAG: hypothetical protein QM621_01220 [Aeromicrobium sp.]|uniref:hypothetical protein n=1 Tax=Aeromicrobium sp. TaxID=1871063 RepID=UPI0039E5F903
MPDDAVRRPPAVTIACLFALFAAILVVVDIATVLSDWGSLELQEAVETGIAEAGLQERVGMGTVLSWLRGVLYVLVVLAVAMGVFAFFALRGDRQSRVALTVLSGLAGMALALGGGFWALLPAVLVTAVAFVLWTPEARVWFDTVNGRTPSPQLLARAKARQGGPAEPSATSVRPDFAAPPGPTPPGLPVRRPRPPGSLIAAAVTMLSGSLITGMFLFSLLMVYALRALDPAEYERLMGTEPLLPEAMYGLSDDSRTVLLTVLVIVLLGLVAGLAALAALVLLIGRPEAFTPSLALAYVGLIGSAAALPTSLPITVAAVATVILLRRTEVRRWARGGRS